MVIVDTNVLVDVLQDDPKWADWSVGRMRELAKIHELAINPIIYSELSLSFEAVEDLDAAIAELELNLLELTRPALFLAGKAFAQYSRRRTGARTTLLPDFFIGAQAAVLGCAILTRDTQRYGTYFPTVELLTPDPNQLPSVLRPAGSAQLTSASHERSSLSPTTSGDPARTGDSRIPSLTVHELFTKAGLVPSGPVVWGEPVPEHGPGVYVIALVPRATSACGELDTKYLLTSESARWIDYQPVIYVGSTERPLATRLSEFYRHRHGEPAPHRGGQAVKLLQCRLWAYWAPVTASDAKTAERVMLRTFEEHTGKLPYANRRR